MPARNVGAPKKLRATSYQFWNWGGRGVRKEEAATDARHRRAQRRAAGQIPGELRRYGDMSQPKPKLSATDAPKGPANHWPISRDGLDAERRRATLLGLRTSSPFFGGVAESAAPSASPMRNVPHWQATGQEPPGLAAAGSRVTGLTGRL